MIDGVTMLRIVLSLAVVLATILAFAHLLRHHAPRRATGWVETLGSESLDGGARLHLIRVARRIYLVAQGPGGRMTRLDVWPEDEFPLESLALHDEVDDVDEDAEMLLDAPSPAAALGPRRRAWEAFRSLGRLREDGRAR